MTAVRLWGSGLTTASVAKEMGCSRALVSLYLKSAGIDGRKRRYARYSLETSFFENINSHEKAYWLGFLLADGHILKNGRAVVLELQTRDKPHLEKLAGSISFDGPIKETRHVHPKNGKEYWAAQLMLCSKQMTDSLADLGWGEFKKSGDLHIVESVGVRLLPSLMRGMWDGDGSLVVSEGQLFLTFCDMHRSVVEWFRDTLARSLGLSLVKIRPARRAKAWIMHYGGNIQVPKIIAWMDSTPGPRLERKRVRLTSVWRPPIPLP